jgi:hypothetical protein
MRKASLTMVTARRRQSREMRRVFGTDAATQPHAPVKQLRMDHEHLDTTELAEALQTLLDRMEEIRSMRIGVLDPKVTDAMVDARVALDL